MIRANLSSGIQNAEIVASSSTTVTSTGAVVSDVPDNLISASFVLGNETSIQHVFVFNSADNSRIPLGSTPDVTSCVYDATNHTLTVVCPAMSGSAFGGGCVFTYA